MAGVQAARVSTAIVNEIIDWMRMDGQKVKSGALCWCAAVAGPEAGAVSFAAFSNAKLRQQNVSTMARVLKLAWESSFSDGMKIFIS